MSRLHGQQQSIDVYPFPSVKCTAVVVIMIIHNVSGNCVILIAVIVKHD